MDGVFIQATGVVSDVLKVWMGCEIAGSVELFDVPANRITIPSGLTGVLTVTPPIPTHMQLENTGANSMTNVAIVLSKER
jgi:hypothetical protein